MIVPTIHLNGTSKEELLEDLEVAFFAINEAYEKLKRCAPNGRDHYTQGPDAIVTATNEHMSRLRRIDDVKNELEQLSIAINEQG